LQTGGDLRNAAETSLPSTDTSDPITGTWGTFTLAVIKNSWTEDTDNNGKIDRIVAEVEGTLNLNDVFSGVTASVTGYETADIHTGSFPGDTIFCIDLVEGPDLDTQNTPAWWFAENTTLALVPTSELIETKDGPTGESPIDQTPPIISYTLAMAGKDEIFVCFSEPVQTPGGGIISTGDFIGYSGAATITGRTRITTQGEGTQEVLLSLSANVTADEIFNQETITTSALEDAAGLPLISQTHRVTDIGLGIDPDNNVIHPVWAQDETEQDPDMGSIGYISVFNGSRWLKDQNITLQAHIHDDISGSGLDVRLHFDVDVPDTWLKRTLWLPVFNTADYNGLVPYFNPDARELDDTEAGAQLRNYIIPGDDSEIENNADLEFLFEITAIQLYCARVRNPDASNWYRTLTPWAFSIHDIIRQESNVTILNNVINPALGERVSLYYVLSKSGTVTITVFDLKGDIVDVLFRGRKSKGEYFISWDGRNRGGRIVARGVYFIKINTPGISEIRKVLVVK
ncbi:MAG: T9SS type A sorting domain-containing protein, partial [Spirochaetales bacterium]|nr:T9SS type A sorting domain-containing protein [Spirochaetales bacterium]